MTSQQQSAMMMQVIKAIYLTIAEAPMGAPSGVIYAAAQSALPGYTLEVHTSIIQALKKTGKIRESNNLLFATASLN